MFIRPSASETIKPIERFLTVKTAPKAMKASDGFFPSHAPTGPLPEGKTLPVITVDRFENGVVEAPKSVLEGITRIFW